MDAANIKLAATALAVTEAAATAFDMGGVGKLIASGLSGNEFVLLYEEYPDDTYRPAINKSGTAVILTVLQPSVIVDGYGSYKLIKEATAGNVAVAYLAG